MTTDFLHKLIDWKEFELFVRDLYKDNEEVKVDHDVTETGKSGVTRQIDVRVTHKTKLHTYKTIIECKSWKNSVDRARVDVLFASMEDLNASKGVIFTTKGYQEGAVDYAKYKNIDIFIVRDLTEDEWGKPGRHIKFYLQFYNAIIRNIQFPNASILPTTTNYPKELSIKIEIKKDFLDENHYLFSQKDGQKGKHLVEVLLQIRNKLLKTISEQTGLLNSDQDNKPQIGFKTRVFLDVSEWEYRHLHYQFGIIRLDKIDFTILTSIDQTKFEFDRARNFDFALVVENYITKQRNVVAKAKSFSTFTISENLKDTSEQDNKDALQNGMVFKVFFEPFVSFSLKDENAAKQTEDLNLKPK